MTGLGLSLLYPNQPQGGGMLLSVAQLPRFLARAYAISAGLIPRESLNRDPELENPELENSQGQTRSFGQCLLNVRIAPESRPQCLITSRHYVQPLDYYFARFHTKSNVIPAGVRGFVNFISSAVMDVMIRR
jgi:hypothetical protein